MRTTVTSCLALVFLGLSGCVFARARTNIADFHTRVESVIVGQTRITEVSQLLGSPPNNIIPAADGKTVFLYTFADSKTGGLNLVIFNTRKSNVGVDTALIIFDKNGVVEQVNVSENSKDLEWDWWAFGS